MNGLTRAYGEPKMKDPPNLASLSFYLCLTLLPRYISDAEVTHTLTFPKLTQFRIIPRTGLSGLTF